MTRTYLIGKSKFMQSILFFYPDLSSFVKKDIEIISSKFNLSSFHFYSKYKPLTVFVFLKQLFFIIKKIDGKTIFVTQFAGYQSVIPTFIGKLFGIKNYIILGGTDCNWLPSINYGNYNKKLLRWATEYSLKNTYHLIPVNDELVECDYQYTNLDFKKQGFKSFIKNIKTPYTVIPNGIDLRLYYNSKHPRNQKSFITICSSLEDERRRFVKGIDLILEIAHLIPDINITIVGGAFPSKMIIPSNITTLPYVPNDKLPELYNAHQYYFQLSLTEGFPNALIESMACGCVPIVSSVGAMPEIVRNVGHILGTKNMDLLKDIIIRALDEYNDQSALAARKRAEDFDINFRALSLIDLLLINEK